MAAKGYSAQRGITNVAFNDCRKSATNRWRQPTGKNYEHGVTAKLRLLVKLVIPYPPLQHPASLYLQNIQRHLQLRDGRADFWMLSDLLLQGF